MNQGIDFNTLKWVKRELDTTLKDARQALEAYVENPDDDSQLVACASHLHQVQGTLQMVEIYGAALLAEEMEHVAKALADGQIRERDDAYELLMRSILQLPDYLERLSEGHRDVPLVLLPLLNDLRATRGQHLLSENALFSPDLTRPLPESLRPAGTDEPEQSVVEAARRLRHRFQLGLLAWYRKQKGGAEQSDAGLDNIRKVLETLQQVSREQDVIRLWWVARGLVDALALGALDPSVASTLLLGQVDRQIKRLIDEGEAGLAADPNVELLKNLLFYVASSKDGNDQVQAIKGHYELSSLLPSAAEVADARDSLSGRNADLMHTVSEALKEDLTRVKDGLDVYLRSAQQNTSDLEPLVQLLDKISDTLGMLGEGASRTIVQQQAELLGQIVAGQTDCDESVLMEVASALLVVDARLAGLSAPQGKGVRSVAASQKGHLSGTDYSQILGVVAQEAVADLSRAKDAILTCIDGSWDFEHLESVPPLLQQIKGGLLLLGEDYAAAIVGAVVDYLRADLLDVKQALGEEELDTLADVLSGIEYYLEDLKENRIFSASVLEGAAASLEKLGHPVEAPPSDSQADSDEASEHDAHGDERAPWGDVEDIVLEFPHADAPPSMEDGMADSGAADTEQLPAVDVPADAEVVADSSEVPPEKVGDDEPTRNSGATDTEEVGASQSSPPALALAEDVDDEILEIFVEEAEEEFASIKAHLAVWRDNPDDGNALSTMRRSYHTLKGSGRLVGAVGIGEFSWAFENMLNRVIDGTVAADDVMFALLESGTEVLGELIDQVKGGAAPTANTQAFMDCADALSRGDSVDMADVDAARASSQSAPLPDAEEGQSPADDGVPTSADADVSMDPVLFEIFQGETRSHTATIREFIDGYRAQGGACKVTEPLLRALHTLHGSARMAGADSVATLAGELERYAKALLAEQLPIPSAGVTALEDAANLIDDVVSGIGQQGIEAPDCASMCERIAALQRTRSEIVDEAGQHYIDYDFGLPFEHGETDALPIPETEDGLPDGEVQGQSEAEPVDLGGGSEQSPSARQEAPFPEEQDQQADVDEFDLETSAGAAEGDAELSADFGEVDTSFQIAEPSGETSPALTAESGDVDAPLPEGRVEDSDDLPPPSAASDNGLEAHVSPGSSVEESDQKTSIAPDQEWASAAAGGEEADAELVEIFLEEGAEILENIEATLQNWVHSPDNPEHMRALQRDLHTLKGGARMAGLQALGDLSHGLESLLNGVVDGHVAVSRRLHDLLEISHDRLVHMLERARTRQPLESVAGLIQEVENLRHGVACEPPLETAQESDLGFEKPIAEQQHEKPDTVIAGAVEGIAVVEPPAEVDGEEQHADRRTAARVQQELVRVRADLLDDFVNYAGEISIYRARLEQQVGAFGFNLVEFDQTVTRLREQLRKLEMETEAQILFRYERESTEDDDQENFDPLELDRYSHLQQLSRSLMESVSDLVSIQGLLANTARESETLLMQQSRVNTELQEGLMRTRMVPFARLAPRLRRIVRQTCHELGKQAQLFLDGAEGEMDRTVIDRIVPPLEHMLRNAISHGIETPAERAKVGKGPTGHIRISLARDAADVVIQVVDDGAGMDLDAIRGKALERGLLVPGAETTDHDVMQFILETGFSTAEEITQVAGRGVGMDVVNSEVKQLGGSLDISSRRGEGAAFTVRLPFTLAINKALLVQVAEENYAIPLTSIEGIVRLSSDDLAGYLADQDSVFEYAAHQYRVQKLVDLLGTAPSQGGAGTKRVPVLLVRSGEHRLALAVDAVLGSREIVVKSVGPQLSTVRAVSGATILGDGRVVLILDLGALVRAGGVVPQTLDAALAEAANEPDVVRVMVVDDSITVRKITARLLERNNMDVVTAKDGVDAVTKLQEQLPDVMLLDIEMPRMDGFELATHIRNEERLRHIPIIMITSRTGDKHRKRAMEIGVDRYLGKPYQESDLLGSISSVLSERLANA